MQPSLLQLPRTRPHREEVPKEQDSQEVLSTLQQLPTLPKRVYLQEVQHVGRSHYSRERHPHPPSRTCQQLVRQMPS